MSTNNRARRDAIEHYLREYETYEEQFNPVYADRRARRKRKPRVDPHERKVAAVEVVSNLVDEAAGLEGGFQTTYQPGQLEEGWLLDSLRAFYDQHLIADVLAVVKGGKEASVYRCAATENVDRVWLAAKVYRPRTLRHMRNDATYRQGRQTLTENGRAVKKTDHRLMRALGKKSSFGTQVAHTSWLMYEYTTLQKLHEAGAAVPVPYGVSENAILMSYHGSARLPAPTLSEISLASEEARPLFLEVLRNVDLLLQHGLIHGDLSPYNILYWEGEITLIDFPQVIQIHSEQGGVNGNAYPMLRRDIERVCAYFARQGVRNDPRRILTHFWDRYARQEQEQLLADWSRHTGDESRQEVRDE